MIDVAKEGHKLPAINLAKLIRLYGAVWGTGKFPAQAVGGGLRVEVDAEVGSADHWLEGTDGRLGRYPVLEAMKAATLLDQLRCP